MRRLTGVGLTIVVLVGAVAVGYALNGTWAGLTTLRLRWRRLVVAAVIAQTGGAALGILGVTDARRGYVVGLAVSAMCAAAFCVGNLHVPGVPLVTLGLAANALVVTDAETQKPLYRKVHAPAEVQTISFSSDGRRFLMMKAAPAAERTSTAPRIVVVQNWFEELKARAPVK